MLLKGANWRPEQHVATVLQVLDHWQDPHEQYPPRKQQSEGYSGPIPLTDYQRFKFIRDELAKDGFSIPLPSGNWPLIGGYPRSLAA